MSDLEEESNTDVDTAADEDDEYEGVKPKITLGDLTKIDDDIIKIDDTDIDSEQDEGGGLDSEDEQDESDNDDDDDDGDGDGDDAKPVIDMNPDIFQEAVMTGEDSDESSDEDEDYLKKFDNDVVSNYIDIYHPESRMHNYDEVRTLSSVIRDEDGTVVDDIHKTVPFLTKFEKAKILGLRAKQINEGARPFVKVPDNVVNGYTIAEIELTEKKIPFIIRRPIPNGGSEYWKLSDLENII